MAKRDIDFDDEDAVLAAVAADPGEDPDDLKIDDTGRGFSSFGTDTFYYIQTSGGRRGWVVARSYDAMEEVALAVVKQDLESEPELFDQDLIESHINVERLRRDLYSDLHAAHMDDFNEMSERDIFREAAHFGVDTEEYVTTDEDGIKQAIKIGGIDIAAAAQDAVDTDGAIHYLGSYDGNYSELPDSDIVYWRTD